MPYRIDLCGAAVGAFDRLVELGALDVEARDDGLAALMPDGIVPETVADVLGTRGFAVSPAVGHDANSVWMLRPRPVRAGGHTLALLDSPVFGTGLHPTTALCLEFLEEIVPPDPPGAVLDVGTGSGVLAIAALKLGAARATAIDIDEGAVTVAAGNARANGVADRLDVRCGGPESIAGVWPLVLANILAAPLVEMAPHLGRRVGHYGRLVLSGIPRAVAPDVIRAYTHIGMRHAATKTRAEWIALLLQSTW